MSNDGLDEAKVQESLEYEKWLHEKAKREKVENELSHIKKEAHKAKCWRCLQKQHCF